MSVFLLNSSLAPRRMALFGAAAIASVLVAGCGSVPRAVVTTIPGSGPAAQPTSYAVVVSQPGDTNAASTPGVATIVDYSGDSVMAISPIGVGPIALTLDATGSTAYTINSDTTISSFPVSSNLQPKQVQYSTLPSLTSGGSTIAPQPENLFANGTNLFALDLNQPTTATTNANGVDVLAGSPQAYKLTVPVAIKPVTMVGISSAQRYYAISQVSSGCGSSPTTQGTGIANAVENATDTVSAQIPVGVCPVYAVASSDGQRVFVLNRGDGTISVINAQTNAIDSCPAGTVNQNGQAVTCHPSIPVGAGPVYGEYNAATGQLVVANYDAGTISIIDVSLDVYGNDSSTFGTTFTVPVGNHPAAVTVLTDGSRAYVANETDGTVSIVNMASHTVEKTIDVVGNPRNIVSTENTTQYGKVYVSSPNSPYLTIIRTDEDIISTTILVEGNIVDVRVSTQNAKSGNSNFVSRILCNTTTGANCYGQP